LKTLKQFLISIFPFAITLLLWRMSSHIFNPGGILALVPIFYYSIISVRPNFLPAALIGCFLVDYNFDTMLFWTTLFCTVYAINGFVVALKPSIQRGGGFAAFAGFVGVGLFMLGFRAFVLTWSVAAIFQMIWMFGLCIAAYAGCIYINNKIK